MRITEFPMIGEIKDEYLNARRRGVSRTDAVEALKVSYHNELTLGAEDDGLIFWVGLADAQYACKELSSEIAEQALAAIEKLRTLDWEICPGDLDRRVEHYASAPMPERTKFGKSRKFRCSWKLGDTFAYRLSGPEAEEVGLEGVHVILRKVDEMEFGDGRLLPVVTLTMWQKDHLPTNQEEFQTEPLLKLASGRLLSPRNLYEYRAEIIISSKKKLERLSLVYIGNFSDIPMPSDEVIMRGAGCVCMLLPEQFSRNCCVCWKRHNYYVQHRE